MRYTTIGVAGVLLCCCRAGFGMDKPVKVTFEGQAAEHKWALKELDARLPSDWSDFNYLVLEIRTDICFCPRAPIAWVVPGQARSEYRLQAGKTSPTRVNAVLRTETERWPAWKPGV